jgi:DNA repair protein RadD
MANPTIHRAISDALDTGPRRYFDDLIIAATTQDLITAGYLSPFRVFAPSHPDLTQVRTVAGDYHEGDLSSVMNDSTLVADVVDTWLRRAQNRSTFCFAVDRAHAKHPQEKFVEAGVSTGYIDA